LKTESIREKLFGNGANISNLNQTMLQSLEIPCPPLSLQQAYTAYVKKVGQAKVIVNQEIAHLQELLDSRMDFYFRK
jgi:type I restriction enzyme S subunit